MTYQNLKSNLRFTRNVIVKGMENNASCSGGVISNIGVPLKTWSVTNYNLAGIDANYIGFSGACFDGRYLYLNNSDGTDCDMIRYDTTADFSTSGSYASVDLTAINVAYKGFVSSCFDGRYVYYVSYHNGSDYVGYIARYDTKEPFTSVLSWSVIDLTSEDSDYVGNFGCSLIGKYLYIIPLTNGNSKSHILRYDITATFAASSFVNFDTTTINANYKEFLGGCNDGRYLYIPPWVNGNFMRYDTTASFASSASYEIMDLSGLSSNYKGYADALFDGRYVYLIPRNGGGSLRHGYLCIYDTTKDFNTDAIRVIDLESVNANYKGFESATFDGRYVYLIPFDLDGTTKHGNLVRLDTLNDFAVSALNIASVSANFVGYNGGIVLGKYLYLIPNINNTAAHGNFIKIRIKP